MTDKFFTICSLLYFSLSHTPELKVPEIGGGEAGEVDLSVDVVVVAVRRGAADELAGRIRPRVNPLTRIPLKAEMHGTNG